MEEYITLGEATKLLPARAARSTILRWCCRGITVSGNDQIIRMRFVRIGRRYFTTAIWVEEFIHRLTAATMASQDAWMRRHRRLDRTRQRQLAEADAILARAGI